VPRRSALRAPRRVADPLIGANDSRCLLLGAANWAPAPRQILRDPSLPPDERSAMLQVRRPARARKPPERKPPGSGVLLSLHCLL
jgi:hypothetical protein